MLVGIKPHITPGGTTGATVGLAVFCGFRAALLQERYLSGYTTADHDGAYCLLLPFHTSVRGVTESTLRSSDVDMQHYHRTNIQQQETSLMTRTRKYVPHGVTSPGQMTNNFPEPFCPVFEPQPTNAITSTHGHGCRPPLEDPLLLPACGFADLSATGIVQYQHLAASGEPRERSEGAHPPRPRSALSSASSCTCSTSIRSTADTAAAAPPPAAPLPVSSTASTANH